jgi:hypothetical protein
MIRSQNQDKLDLDSLAVIKAVAVSLNEYVAMMEQGKA